MADDPRTTFAARWKAHEATLAAGSVPLDATLRPDAIETAPTMLPQSVPALVAVDDWSHASLPRIALTAAPREVTPTSQPTIRSGAEFEVVNVLGEGGMGRVHLARQRSLDRDVALKSLRHEVASPMLATSLLHEARVTGGLEHPSIVPVHALGVDERGYPLLVMKRIEGVSWRDLLREPDHSAWQRLAERDARAATGVDRLDFHLDVLASVCDALEFAHANGVVHRDVKPENVMIGFFGEVYLVDWGIAIRTRTRTGESIANTSETGPAGTPAYMAPEMLVPGVGSIDARTDVFLLGATLHELLTGNVRHGGHSIAEVLQSVYLCEPASYGAEVPVELGALANRATAREPAQRPESAAAFRRALADYVRHRGSVMLADRASAISRELDALVAEPEPDATRVARMAGEARFGFAQALAEWSENLRAREGLESLLRTLVDFEIRRRNAAGARALLDEMRMPTEALREKLAALDRELEAEREKAAQLDAMTHELDESVGARARAYAMSGMVVLAVVLGIIAVRMPGHLVSASLLLRFGLLIAGTATATTVVFWKALGRNQSSRRLVGILLLYVWAMVAHRGFAVFNGTPAPAVLRDDLFIGSALIAAAAISHFRWTVWMAAILFTGSLAATAWPARTPAIFGLATTATILMAMATWLRISRVEKK